MLCASAIYFSPQAVSFTVLQQLDVSNNSLVVLPEGLLELGELVELNVAGNKLKELPKVDLPDCPRLRILKWCCNIVGRG